MTSVVVKVVEQSPFYLLTGLPIKLTEQIRSFFEFCLLRNFSKRTVRAYAFDLVIFFRFHQGKKKSVPTFKNINIQTLIEFIYQEKGRLAAPRSINRRINTVDMLYRHCYKKLIPGTQPISNDPVSMRGRRYLTMDSTLGIYPIYKKTGKALRLKIPHELIKTSHSRTSKRRKISFI